MPRRPLKVNGSLSTALAICAGLLASATCAQASIVTFTDRLAWESALKDAAGFVCEDFENEPLPPFGAQPTPYTTAEGTLLVHINAPPVPIQYLNPGLLGSGELHFRDFTRGVRFAFPVTGNAFGFEYDTGPDMSGDNMTVTASGTSIVLPFNTTGFIGYIENTGAPIPFFEIVGAPGPQGGISIDDLCHTSPLDHFVCYDVKESKKINVPVQVTNQFGTEVFIVRKARLLCVPSTKEKL